MELWVGLAHVKPRRGNNLIGDAPGAFVPSVGLAQNQEDFLVAVVNLLHKYEFDVVEIEDIEALRNRELHGCIDPKVSQLAASLSPENPVGLGSFHTYQQAGESEDGLPNSITDKES